MTARTPTASWPALGSSAVLRLSPACELTRAIEIVNRHLDAIDRACSRFRDDSELSLVNARPGRPVAVGSLLLDALEVALRAAALTGGALDPSIGLSLERAGYDRDWELIAEDRRCVCEPSPALIARRRPAWREIELDRARGTVRIPRGTKLDLGATAKALAADMACEDVHEQLGCGVLLALGGDLVARGVPPDGGWPVHVTDDHRDGPDSPGQTVSIAGGGLATSSTVARSWSRSGRRMHHIIDPTTGEPAETRWRTVSVAAADCTDANIASTGALLRDGDAPDWLLALGLPARLVQHDGAVRTVAGWPSGDGEMPRVAVAA
ncbi:MAG: FAD:protein FMN transferase [Solirubrobacteraceae bacterium]